MYMYNLIYILLLYREIYCIGNCKIEESICWLLSCFNLLVENK